jgi:anti-anti-sigma factor
MQRTGVGASLDESEDALPQEETPETEHDARSDERLAIDHCLRLYGELTQATVRDFEKALRAVLQASPRKIVVDLNGVDHVDEAGLTALLKAHLRSRRHGLPIEFVPSDHAAVKQVVATTGTDPASD